MDLQLEPIKVENIPGGATPVPRYADILTSFEEGREEAAKVLTDGTKPATVVSGLRTAVTKNGWSHIRVMTRKGEVYLIRKDS